MLVIANGMVRSGSTLQYNMAARLLGTKSDFEKIGFLGDINDSVHLERIEKFKIRTNGTALLKTHSFPKEIEFYESSVYVLFCYRDFRDIAASIKKKWGWSFDVIIKRLDNLILLEESIMKLPNVLSQSYDTLFNSPDIAIQEMANFLNLVITSSDVIAFKEQLSVSAIRDEVRMTTFAKIKKSIFKKVDFDQDTLLHQNHISKTKGQKGDWKNQFSQKEIDILHTRYSGWLSAKNFI